MGPGPGGVLRTVRGRLVVVSARPSTVYLAVPPHWLDHPTRRQEPPWTPPAGPGDGPRPRRTPPAPGAPALWDPRSGSGGTSSPPPVGRRHTATDAAGRRRSGLPRSAARRGARRDRWGRIRVRWSSHRLSVLAARRFASGGSRRFRFSASWPHHLVWTGHALSGITLGAARPLSPWHPRSGTTERRHSR